MILQEDRVVVREKDVSAAWRMFVEIDDVRKWWCCSLLTSGRLRVSPCGRGGSIGWVPNGIYNAMKNEVFWRGRDLAAKRIAAAAYERGNPAA
jgi:hypothetical protein